VHGKDEDKNVQRVCGRPLVSEGILLCPHLNENGAKASMTECGGKLKAEKEKKDSG
jgi:hypothetical protein